MVHDEQDTLSMSFAGQCQTFADVCASRLVSAAISTDTYMLALLFLVFRPQGLFGEKIIERV